MFFGELALCEFLGRSQLQSPVASYIPTSSVHVEKDAVVRPPRRRRSRPSILAVDTPALWILLDKFDKTVSATLNLMIFAENVITEASTLHHHLGGRWHSSRDQTSITQVQRHVQRQVQMQVQRQMQFTTCSCRFTQKGARCTQT